MKMYLKRNTVWRRKVLEMMSTPVTAKNNDVKDDNTVLFLSFGSHLKGLEPRYKSAAKLHIMQVLNDVQWARFDNSSHVSNTSY